MGGALRSFQKVLGLGVDLTRLLVTARDATQSRGNSQSSQEPLRGCREVGTHTKKCAIPPPPLALGVTQANLSDTLLGNISRHNCVISRKNPAQSTLEILSPQASRDMKSIPPCHLSKFLFFPLCWLLWGLFCLGGLEGVGSSHATQKRSDLNSLLRLFSLPEEPLPESTVP